MRPGPARRPGVGGAIGTKSGVNLRPVRPRPPGSPRRPPAPRPHRRGAAAAAPRPRRTPRTERPPVVLAPGARVGREAWRGGGRDRFPLPAHDVPETSPDEAVLPPRRCRRLYLRQRGLRRSVRLLQEGAPPAALPAPRPVPPRASPSAPRCAPRPTPTALPRRKSLCERICGMFGGGKSCCSSTPSCACPPVCCEPTCCAPMQSSCTPADTCCEVAPTCCAPMHSSCTPVCAAPVHECAPAASGCCVTPTCAAPCGCN